MVQGTLVFGASKPSSTAILIWWILTTFQVIFSIVLTTLLLIWLASDTGSKISEMFFFAVNVLPFLPKLN